MAYTPKAYSATLRYLLHQAHVAFSEGECKLNGITRLSQNPQAQYFNPYVLGRLMPVFRALNTAEHHREIETVGLGQLFETVANGGLEMGLVPYHVTGVSGNVLKIWWAAITELAGISNVGILETMTKGVLHLDRIRAMQDQPATAILRAIPIWNGSAALLGYDDVADLDASTGALATEQECWTFGGVTIDNVAVSLASGFEFTNLPFETLHVGGNPFARYGNLGKGMPMFRIPLETPVKLSDLGITGVAAFGTETDPAVAATSAVFRCLRCEPFGARRIATDGDIEIVVNHGAVTVEEVPGTAEGRLVNAINVWAHDDRNNPAVIFTRNADGV